MNSITVCRVEAFGTPGAHFPVKSSLPGIRPDASRPPARRAPANDPLGEKVAADPAQVPPEAPLSMRAQPFDFVAIRDIVGFLFPACRSREQAAPAGARPPTSPQRQRASLR